MTEAHGPLRWRDDAMVELPEQLEAALHAYQQEGPSVAERASMRALLLTQTRPAEAGPSTRSSMATAQGWTLAVVGTGLLGALLWAVVREHTSPPSARVASGVPALASAGSESGDSLSECSRDAGPAAQTTEVPIAPPSPDGASFAASEVAHPVSEGPVARARGPSRRQQRAGEASADREDVTPEPGPYSGPLPVAEGESPAGDGAAAELALLARARRALSSSPARTLALTAEHARLFARGSFVQEREVIAIEALIKQGMRSDAERRTAAFERHYPRSAHRARLRVLLAPP